MIKLYTDKQYAEKALEANKAGKKLYVYTHSSIIEEEILEYEEQEIEIRTPVFNPDGSQKIGEDGEFVFNVEVQKVTVPKLIDKEITVEKIIIDEDGNEKIVQEQEIIQVQASHIEKKEQIIAELKIADDGYYICYKDNYTDGTVNEDYEKEKQEKQRKYLDSLTLTPSDVERALFKSLQMDFDDLKKVIQKKAPQINIKAIGIELRANLFYRGATLMNGIRLIDTVGALLGYTSEDMDYLFINKELPIKEIIEEE